MVEAASQFLKKIHADVLAEVRWPPIGEYMVPILETAVLGGVVGAISYAMSMFLALREASEGLDDAKRYVAAGGYPERWVLAGAAAGAAGAVIKALVEGR